MTVKDVAELRHVTTNTVRSWIRTGKLEARRLDFGGRKPAVRIDSDAYERFVRAMDKPGRQGTGGRP